MMLLQLLLVLLLLLLLLLLPIFLLLLLLLLLLLPSRQLYCKMRLCNEEGRGRLSLSLGSQGKYFVQIELPSYNIHLARRVEQKLCKRSKSRRRGGMQWLSDCQPLALNPPVNSCVFAAFYGCCSS